MQSQGLSYCECQDYVRVCWLSGITWNLAFGLLMLALNAALCMFHRVCSTRSKIDIAMALKKQAKGAGGAASAGPKKVAVKQEIVKKEKEQDSAKLQAMQAARTKAAQTRAVKSTAKKASAGATSLAQASTNLDRDFVINWLDDRKFMIPFVANLMRNGLLEKNYLASLQDGQIAGVDPGKRVFSEGASKFGSIKGSICVELLSELIGQHVVDWFKGESKLSLEVAVKAVLFMLGVDKGTAIPKGHKLAAFYKPLLWLFKRRVEEIGGKLSDVTKGNLDAETDWFVLSEGGDTVICNTKPKTEVKLAIDMSGYHDWVIVDGHDYTKAQLVSDEAGMDTSLARPFERHNTPPVFNKEFHFPEGASPPDFPKHANESSPAVVDPQQMVIDAALNAAKVESAGASVVGKPIPVPT